MVFILAILTAVWIIGAFACFQLLFRNWRRPFFMIVGTYALTGGLVMAGWMTLICVWAALGGNPSLGKVEAGRYFVGQHRVYHEVSPQTYFRLQDAQALLEKTAWWWFLLLPVGLIAAVVEFGWDRSIRMFLPGRNRQPPESPEDLQSRQF